MEELIRQALLKATEAWTMAPMGEVDQVAIDQLTEALLRDIQALSETTDLSLRQ